MKYLITILSIFIFSSAYAAENHFIENKLIGTWKLISMTQKNLSTGTESDDYGPNPIGYLNYAVNNRMMVIIARNDRKKPTGKIATNNEAALLFKTMTSYAGTYHVNGSKIIHHIDVSWNPSWVGTNQIRFYKLEGRHLVLTMAPFFDPMHEKITVRLVWEKVD
jgi:hypothetical protein